VFGCTAYAHVPDAQTNKLDKKSQKYRFVGYSNEPKGYRLLEEKSSKVFIRRDVIFNETDFGQRTKEVNTQQEKVEIEIKPEVEPDTQMNQKNQDALNTRDNHLLDMVWTSMLTWLQQLMTFIM
jgi:hypothetical protein